MLLDIVLKFLNILFVVFSLAFILDSFYCYVLSFINPFICRYNLLLILSSVFFISDILFFSCKSLISVSPFCPYNAIAFLNLPEPTECIYRLYEG